MAEHKHEWSVTVLGGAACVADWDREEAYNRQCIETLTASAVQRRLNAFDALVEALKGLAIEHHSDASDKPLETCESPLCMQARAALRLARGDSEVRA